MTEFGLLIRSRKFWCVSILLFIALSSYAQRARLFSTDSELSSSLIAGIHQDHKRIIWIATEDGINRYDGSKFKIYREKNGILANNVRLIFEDSQHNLFFGFFNGLQIYDYASDSFKNIPLVVEGQEEVHAHVLAMMERKDGTILIGTSGFGVFSLSSEGGKMIAHQLPGYVPSRLVNHLFEDDNQNLWVSTQDNGLFRMGDRRPEKHYFDPSNGLDSNITSICEDKDGTLYVASLNKGLFKYDKVKDYFQKVRLQEFSFSPISVLYPMQNGQLLIGTDGEGMKLFNPAKGLVSNLNFNVSNFDFSKSKVHSIIEDDQGNFWLGLFQKGVAIIPSRANNFKYIGYQSVTNNIIGSNYIMSIFKDRAGVLWVGTDSDGLYSVSPEGEQLAHFSHSKKPNSAPATVMCMYEDSNNDLWIGAYLTGLARLKRQTGTFEHLTNIFTDQSNQVHRIMSITEDADKNLWIGTLGFGLYSMNLVTGEIINYSRKPNPAHPNDAANTLHNAWILSLLFAEKDKLYIGTTNGISVLDLKTKTFNVLNDTYPVLWGRSIETLHQDDLNRLWIGTSQGLICLDPDKKAIREYTVEDGLPSDLICAIENDENQNLWISTNYGISKFNLKDSTFINYFFHDGLQGNEFSKRAGFKCRDGEIFFGGINGITCFKPEDIKENTKAPELSVTGFYVHDVAIKKGMRSGKYQIVSGSVMDADAFHLSHDDNSFVIELSSMEYVNPARITYLYSMNNQNWVSLQRGLNTLTFNNLDPGIYNFKIKAKDFSAHSDIKELSVIIHPAWYFSVWAKLSYFLVSLLILLGMAFQIRQRYKTRKRMQEHWHARQINEAKLEFFTNISHEIRTPLSLILNPLKKLLATDPDTGRQKSYQVMRRNTERILHLVNQLMDLRKIDQGNILLKFCETDITAFIRDITAIFEEQIFEKNIHFQIHRQPALPKVWIDQNYFDKVILNLLANAIKFTPENGEIHLSIETHEVSASTEGATRHLRITCSDSGIGLNEEEVDKIFDRFYQASNTRFHTVGTGIGLHLTRSIVELHHGTIHAENNTGGPGCRFIASIPIDKKHLEPREIGDGNTGSESRPNIHIIPPLPLGVDVARGVKSRSKTRVLVVDDDEEVRRYICSELASDYQVEECANGKETLSVVLKNLPDLIISDVVMPEMDGITLCRKIKQNVNINHIPVILLTARSNEEDNLEGLGIGADAYLVKPFNIEILKKTVRNIIRNREILRNNFGGKQQQNGKIREVCIKSPDEKLLKRVIDVVNENLGNPELNVEMLSREIGISRVHLHRKLKELTNQSTRDFIRNVRLQQAAVLLSNKHMNISEVAFAVGFSNVAHFSNAFKELFGEPPTTYMEIQLKKNKK